MGSFWSKEVVVWVNTPIPCFHLYTNPSGAYKAFVDLPVIGSTITSWIKLLSSDFCPTCGPDLNFNNGDFTLVNNNLFSSNRLSEA